MSQPLRVTTRAKINLHLQILRRRQDGYHEIETIFQSVDLADQLDLSLTDDGRIEISCTDPDIPTDKTNLCHRAIVAMRPHAGTSLGARIHIDKRIPSGAGLGGASSNAAGILLGVMRLRDPKILPKRLLQIAAALGSDVPFMLTGGTMLGRGKGDELTPLVSVKEGYFVIVKPNVSVSTSWAYAKLSFALTKSKWRLNLRAVNAVLTRFPDVGMSFSNAFEDVICPAYPAVASVLDEMMSENAGFASMTGSGSALYAVVGSEVEAVRLAERFSVRGLFTSVVKPAARAVEFDVA